MSKSDDTNHVPPRVGLAGDRSDQSEIPVPAAGVTPSKINGFKTNLVVIPPAPKAKPAPTPPKLHLEHKSPGTTQKNSVEKPHLLVLPTAPRPQKKDLVDDRAVLSEDQPLSPAAPEPCPVTPPLRLIPLAELQQARLSSPVISVASPAAGAPRVALQSGKRRQRMPAAHSGRRWLLALPVAVVVVATLGWWMFERTRVDGAPPLLATRPADTVAFPAPPLVGQQVLSTGRLCLSTFARTADGARHTITNKAVVALRHVRTPLTLATNAVLPLVWENLTATAYVLSVTIPGYRPILNADVTVAAQGDTDVALELLPLATNVRFIPSATDVTFRVYQDGRYLGTTKETFVLEPFMAHVLTFKASGWREETVKVTLDSPGITYRCRVATVRIASGMEIAVVSDTGDVPGTGLLSINDSDPVLVTLPLKRTALTYTGEVKISLTSAGYKVLNNPQQVRLADGKIMRVVFRVALDE